MALLRSYMESTDANGPATPPEADDETPRVSACNATPERTVFTEEGNEDGWIATDYSVSVPQ
jgi:hypothetical protein